MCKRFIAIPLLCLVVIMAACPFSVYAIDPSSPSFPYPVNNLSGSFDITFTSNNGMYEITESTADVSFGDLWTGLFLIPPSDLDPDEEFGNGYDVSTDASITLEIISGGDLYIALPNNVQYAVIRNTLSQYRYEAGDYGVDFNEMTVTTYTPDGNLGGFISGTGTGDLDVRFYCYRYIPAGTYHLEFNFYEDPNKKPICFGVYADTRPSMNGFVDTYVNGIINGDINYPDSFGYVDIMSQLREIQQSQSSDNVDLSILRELEYQSAVMYLHDQLDSIFSSLFSDLPSIFDDLFSGYVNGNISESDVVPAFTVYFQELLAYCSTPERVAAASSFIDYEFSRFEYLARYKASLNMDSAISGQEIGAMEDYYQSESELIEAFDQARFQAQLDFDTWFNLLPPDETIEYKKIFDYILNDSPIKNYIMIPVSMGLVTILLGTGIRFVGSKRGENND